VKTNGGLNGDPVVVQSSNVAPSGYAAATGVLFTVTTNDEGATITQLLSQQFHSSTNNVAFSILALPGSTVSLTGTAETNNAFAQSQNLSFTVNLPPADGTTHNISSGTNGTVITPGPATTYKVLFDNQDISTAPAGTTDMIAGTNHMVTIIGFDQFGNATQAYPASQTTAPVSFNPQVVDPASITWNPASGVETFTAKPVSAGQPAAGYTATISPTPPGATGPTSFTGNYKFPNNAVGMQIVPVDVAGNPVVDFTKNAMSWPGLPDPGHVGNSHTGLPTEKLYKLIVTNQNGGGVAGVHVAFNIQKQNASDVVAVVPGAVANPNDPTVRTENLVWNIPANALLAANPTAANPVFTADGTVFTLHFNTNTPMADGNLVTDAAGVVYFWVNSPNAIDGNQYIRNSAIKYIPHPSPIAQDALDNADHGPCVITAQATGNNAGATDVNDTVNQAALLKVVREVKNIEAYVFQPGTPDTSELADNGFYAFGRTTKTQFNILANSRLDLDGHSGYTLSTAAVDVGSASWRYLSASQEGVSHWDTSQIHPMGDHGDQDIAPPISDSFSGGPNVIVSNGASNTSFTLNLNTIDSGALVDTVIASQTFVGHRVSNNPNSDPTDIGGTLSSVTRFRGMYHSYFDNNASNGWLGFMSGTGSSVSFVDTEFTNFNLTELDTWDLGANGNGAAKTLTLNRVFHIYGTPLKIDLNGFADLNVAAWPVNGGPATPPGNDGADDYLTAQNNENVMGYETRLDDGSVGANGPSATGGAPPHAELVQGTFNPPQGSFFINPDTLKKTVSVHMLIVRDQFGHDLGDKVYKTSSNIVSNAGEISGPFTYSANGLGGFFPTNIDWWVNGNLYNGSRPLISSMTLSRSIFGTASIPSTILGEWGWTPATGNPFVNAVHLVATINYPGNPAPVERTVGLSNNYTYTTLEPIPGGGGGHPTTNGNY